MVRHTVLPLSSDIIGFAEIISSRNITEDSEENQSSPILFQTERMARLSTPWPVSLTRAEQLADCRIGKGLCRHVQFQCCLSSHFLGQEA